MHILLLSKRYGSIGLRLPKLLFGVISSISLLACVLIAAGFSLGTHITEQKQANQAILELRGMLHQAQSTVEQVRADQTIHLDALGLRVGALQARMMRLDALGERMVRLGGLDAAEFDFSDVPAMGGNPTDSGLSYSVNDISADLDQVNALLDDRKNKLEALESHWANRDLLQAALPSGRPVTQGWMSSRYGYRLDPFNGRRSHHKGVDFAAQTGTPIHTVASGIVQRSKTVSGFGNVVEIAHADGYSTLYAHNQKNLVSKGDIVHKGQVIALLGSSGRSSGPHVHFEVHKNGRSVDPQSYITRP